MPTVNTYCDITKITNPQCCKCPPELERKCCGTKRIVVIKQ